MTRPMASSQSMGRAEPGAVQVVKLVGPMWVRSPGRVDCQALTAR